jgi:hypothetical protein
LLVAKKESGVQKYLLDPKPEAKKTITILVLQHHMYSKAGNFYVSVADLFLQP